MTRFKAEKTEPSISYEVFVEDSFTTMLMELLVRVRLIFIHLVFFLSKAGSRRKKWQSAVTDKWQLTVDSYPTEQRRACAPSPHHSVSTAIVACGVSLIALAKPHRLPRRPARRDGAR